MSIVLVFCFVVLMLVIRRRKGQSIPLERSIDIIKIEWHEVGGETKEPWTEPNMDKAPLIFFPHAKGTIDYSDFTEEQVSCNVSNCPFCEHLDVTEEQRTETV